MSEIPEALEVAANLRGRIARHPSSDTTRTLLVCDDAARCLEKQHAEVERLKAENEALRLNDARYRYLRNRDPKEVFNKSGKAAGVWIDWEDDMTGLQLLTGDDTDAAIDAAMRREQT